MKRNIIVPIVDIVLSLIGLVIGLIILPDAVPIQFSLSGTFLTAPKLFALAIPTGAGVISSIICFFCKSDKVKTKLYIIMTVALFIFLMIFFSAISLVGTY